MPTYTGDLKNSFESLKKSGKKFLKGLMTKWNHPLDQFMNLMVLVGLLHWFLLRVGFFSIKKLAGKYQRRTDMRRWFRFFLGSPTRATTSFLALVTLGLTHYFFPGFISGIAIGVAIELEPFIYLAITIFFVFLGFKFILKPWTGNKRGKP